MRVVVFGYGSWKVRRWVGEVVGDKCKCLACKVKKGTVCTVRLDLAYPLEMYIQITGSVLNLGIC